MSTLAEIESAADTLPPQEKQELILFLATRLRESGVKLPPPRKFSREQIAAWIAEDEAEMQRLRLFLDTSMVLAACGSTVGASHEIFRLARVHGWVLIVTPYVIEEVLNNLGDFPPAATAQWANLRADLLVQDDVLTLDRPAAFAAGKDRPILFSAASPDDRARELVTRRSSH